MDVAAGILGIQAEIAQNKVKHLRLWICECREPSEDAFKLGFAAAGILGLAHVIANFLGGCVCICSQEDLQRASHDRQLSVARFLFSWIILAAGLSMLGIGTLSNNKSRTSCCFIHHHFFSFGGNLWAFQMARGRNAINFNARDPTGRVWEFKLCTRNHGHYKKPVIRGECLDYVDEKGLTVDDFIILTMVEDAENGVCYNIRVEPNLELAI